MSDLISRQVAVNAVWSLDVELRPSAINAILNMLKDIPSAPSEQKIGKWIETETTYADSIHQECRCSICKQLSPRPSGEFCRWCGADMRGEQGE